MLVEFLGDEGHEGVDDLQELFEYLHGSLQGLAVDGSLVCRLYHLQIPAGELVGEEFEHGHQGLVQAVLAIEVVDFCHVGAQLCLHPLYGLHVGFGLCYLVAYLPTLHQAEGVPNLVAEGGTLSAKAFVKENVVTGRSSQEHAHAHTVGTVLVYERQRVGAVAQLLGHLAAKVVAHDTGEVNVAEWNVLQVFLACHNHACHPEEDDVRTGHQVGGGVVVVDFLVAGVQYAVEQAHGPEP